MSDPALQIEGLSKSFGSTPVLEPLDLQVRHGQFCVLLGPSGCGKSTLLRCIAGLEAPTAGRVSIHGRDVTKLGPAERDVAMVFQNYALYPHMTVRENLAFPLTMRHMPAAERARRIEDVAVLLQIEPLLDRRPSQLSGGQRQRVAIGRALVRTPKLFLFDEPLSNLDARLRGEMRLELARLHRQLNATIVYVTHDQIEAMTLGDSIVVLNRRRIEQVGTPSDIFRRPATKFVAQFLGNPAMNFLTGEVRAGHFARGAMRVPAEVADSDGIELGFRPEAASVVPADSATAREGGAAGTVEWIEDLGAERFAYLRLDDGTRVIVRLAPTDSFANAAPVVVRIDPTQIHLFRAGHRLAAR